MLEELELLVDEELLDEELVEEELVDELLDEELELLLDNEFPTAGFTVPPQFARKKQIVKILNRKSKNLK